MVYTKFPDFVYTIFHTGRGSSLADGPVSAQV
jgi:hypothetical protein